MLEFGLFGARVALSVTDLSLVVALVGGALDRLKYWSAKGENDALAKLVGGASRAAGRIAQDLADIPEGTDFATMKRALVAKQIRWMLDEFKESVASAKATEDKLAGMIEGELGRLGPAPRLLAGAVELRTSVDGLRNELQETIGAAPR